MTDKQFKKRLADIHKESVQWGKKIEKEIKGNGDKKMYFYFFASRRPVENIRELEGVKMPNAAMLTYMFENPSFWLKHNTFRETYGGMFLRGLINGLYPDENSLK